MAPRFDAKEQSLMLSNRLRKNLRKLKKWATKHHITCYRIYDVDIPEILLAIDLYDDHLHVSEYDRKAKSSISPEEHNAWLSEIVYSTAESLGINQEQVHLKRRERKRGKNQYERVSAEYSELIVREGGHRFLVNLSDYLDTGLFLDHRRTRGIVQGESEGKDFLNLFAYTGSFTIYAIKGGAKSTTTVDLSNTYQEWTKKNFDLNEISMGSTHHLVCDDVLFFLQRAIEESKKFDLIVVDPPTFSNSKKMDSHFDVQKHHVELLEKASRLLRNQGVLYFSTNRRGFQIESEKLRHLEIGDITASTIPEDFRNKKIHQCFSIKRRSRRIIG